MLYKKPFRHLDKIRCKSLCIAHIFVALKALHMQHRLLSRSRFLPLALHQAERLRRAWFGGRRKQFPIQVPHMDDYPDERTDLR